MVLELFLSFEIRMIVIKGIEYYFYYNSIFSFKVYIYIFN